MELELPLIRAAAAGDADAFTRIVAAYHRDMTRVAFTIVGRADGADDAVQAAWAIAWRQLGSHREDASLRAWLLKITANEARQVVRRSGRRSLREIPADEGITGPGGSADQAAIPARVDLARALARLSVDDRTLIALRFGADLGYSEIGALVGDSEQAVKQATYRALGALRRRLEADV